MKIGKAGSVSHTFPFSHGRDDLAVWRLINGRRGPVAVHKSNMGTYVHRAAHILVTGSVFQHHLRLVLCKYRGPGIYYVKCSVPVLLCKLHRRGERGRKVRECKFQNKAHKNFDIINNMAPCMGR